MTTLSKKVGVYTKVDIVKPDLPWYIDDKLVTRLRKRKDIGKIPEFMIRDIFKLYYNRNMKYKMAPSMLWWHKILQKVNNYMLKMITKDRIGYSYLVTLHILKNIRNTLQNHPGWKTLNNKRNNELKKMMKWMERMRKAQEKDEKRKQKGQPPLHVPRIGPKPDQDVANSKEYKRFIKNLSKSIDTGLAQATKSIQQLVELEGNADGAGTISCDQVDEYVKTGKLDDGFPAAAINDFVKKTIQKFKDSSVGKKFMIEESLWESEEIEDICNYEDFAHLALLADLTVKSEMRQLTFDLYVDVSGSMSSRIDVSKGKSMTKMELAIGLANKLKKLSMIDKIYCFDTRTWKVELNELNNMCTRGGTCIDNVLEEVKNNKRPAMLLTDCEDSIYKYVDHAFILSVEPYLRGTDGFKKMLEKKNIMMFYKGKMSKPKMLQHGDQYQHPLLIEELNGR
tara:strand:- start:45534 stop:46889 length:1356 start_codon:yes stop_codon:yes gene_type:complete